MLKSSLTLKGDTMILAWTVSIALIANFILTVTGIIPPGWGLIVSGIIICFLSLSIHAVVKKMGRRCQYCGYQPTIHNNDLNLFGYSGHSVQYNHDLSKDRAGQWYDISCYSCGKIIGTFED